MKKITLLVASIFLIGSGVANATERNNNRPPVDFRNADPIVFTERGVKFYIFPDGQFDFNTRPSNDDMYCKSGRRNGSNMTYGSPSNGQNRNYGVKVEHDYTGKVRRIGNVFINYDANDRIKRVGSVYMTYNRYALTQVGGLQIIYNRRGQIVDIFGTVKGGRDYQYVQNNNDDNNHDYGNSQNSNDQDYNYYKTRGTKAQNEDGKVEGRLDTRINN
ncbi:hypothetical protein [Flavobacterium soyangense]|uniref:Uncharacterized protein n=1 Tax=Flavobacterium soyangense TaxID=2023265 RepID=A0A930XUF0_9FLAO|nr:hypothetical protein [Flavobacterium soyangense]MBF2707101.1 hypothetical protein [Flavobacterium soyangense]